MWSPGFRRAIVALVVMAALAACKKDKPTEPPSDDEPTPSGAVSTR